MDSIENVVRENLMKFKLDSLDNQKDNVKRWLVEIEVYVSGLAEIRKKAISTYKKNTLTVKGVSENTGISRQTIYNYPIILQYIEHTAVMCDNEFATTEVKMNKVVQQRDEIKAQFEKMICGLIELNNLRVDAKSHTLEVHKLVQEKEQLVTVLKEKDKEIMKLKKKLYASGMDNLIEIGKK